MLSPNRPSVTMLRVTMPAVTPGWSHIIISHRMTVGAIKEQLAVVLDVLMQDGEGTIEELIQNLMDGAMGIPPTVVGTLSQIMAYNLVGGKFWRGAFAFIATAEAAGVDLTSSTLTPSEEALRHRAVLLAWALEALQAVFLVADDIMDNSDLRRGKPSWFKVPGVGLRAINDGFLLESTCLATVARIEEEIEMGGDLTRLIQKVIRYTEIGQMVDIESDLDGESSIFDSLETSMKFRDVYESIHQHKTAYYTVHLPIAAGLMLGTHYATNKSLVRGFESQLASATLPIGRYFQIQDDFLDMFGSIEKLGKPGMDLAEGKCGWTLVEGVIKAHELGDSDGVKQIQANLGRPDADSASVRAVYTRLGLPQLYTETSCRLETVIAQAVSTQTPVARSLCDKMMAALVGRQK
ncbi:Farnesyl pyrophosphate synthase [Carpediemonas membranifera]|uniref:Farnesyl pyrophosphate synthase n=1 Tax=Carpediemonas membranifera TaxID=201153 RepID=A0A8J6AVB5_9EUKA|nr:Farnesyl pyrophosphate synthase [Carpediemonas membranifera]|eukprot:KAG9395701.1 Farnesyl pyrophosphate synthase [Carpediemonas membranifera]